MILWSHGSSLGLNDGSRAWRVTPRSVPDGRYLSRFGQLPNRNLFLPRWAYHVKLMECASLKARVPKADSGEGPVSGRAPANDLPPNDT